MFRIIEGSDQQLADTQTFIETLNGLATNATAEARDLFDPAAELIVTRAPGRMDVMGGIADYSGSLVLQLPLREATHAALQRTPERTVRIVSLGADANDRSAAFEMPLDSFEASGKPISYDEARAMFQRDPHTQWAAYVAGAFLVLMRQRGARFAEGARMLIASDVPEGKGVSSSAAIEVAAMQAIAVAFDITIEPRDMAILCQMVENHIVGAPCGVMDQMTSACGQANRLMALLCQPAELQGSVQLPDDVAVWGLDSGVRHAVSGADYGSVRIGAFMGYRIIADLAGLEVKAGEPGQPLDVNDPIWGGYLANVTPSQFQQHYADRLPERLTGQRFLDQYGGTADAVTHIDPDCDYAVRMPAAHPIYEHFRVRTFGELLAHPGGERRFELLGELMYQSHASYSACGLGCEGTDKLVELVRAAGPAKGLYGAKITGGGSGGTVAVLGRRGADDAVQAIADQYADQTGRRPYLFAGSTDGAARFGHLRLRTA